MYLSQFQFTVIRKKGALHHDALSRAPVGRDEMPPKEDSPSSLLVTKVVSPETDEDWEDESGWTTAEDDENLFTSTPI